MSSPGDLFAKVPARRSDRCEEGMFTGLKSNLFVDVSKSHKFLEGNGPERTKTKTTWQ